MLIVPGVELQHHLKVKNLEINRRWQLLFKIDIRHFQLYAENAWIFAEKNSNCYLLPYSSLERSITLDFDPGFDLQ